MKLFNTLGRQLQTVQPIHPGHISLYTCGPTVYHYYHVGNLRNAIFNDILKRALLINGFKVEHVMNVTDVGHLTSDADQGEDKLEKGATREGKTVWDVADFYLAAFKHDVEALNILEPSRLERATAHIDDQIKLVQILLDKGYAYQTGQAVYFDVTKVKDYGKLSGQKLADKLTAARSEVVTDPNKHHPQDFALWFLAVGRFKDHSMQWDSPWGKGFPGWHLECSAIIKATLGDTIDIHTGGVDHIGTHHTNEIAQSEAANDQPLARIWLHNEFILIDGRKMAKSAENFYSLTDLIARGFQPLAFRLLCLQAHYHSELNFSWESLTAAQANLDNLQAWADLVFQPAILPKLDSKAATKLESDLKTVLVDDLDTPRSLVLINELVDSVAPTPALLRFIDDALGLNLSDHRDISADQTQLINQREVARQSKDYQTSDKLRQQLSDQGLMLEDTPNGPRWRRHQVVTE